MSENFFLDNPDVQFRLAQLDLREVLELKEKGYSEADLYPTAPRNHADAMDSFRIVLDVLGEICGERVAPRAAEADEEGAHYEAGKVTYAAATLDAIEALRQAALFAGRGLRGDGPDRGGRRLGPGRRGDPGDPGRGHRPVAPQRCQAFHHQRAGGRVAGPG